MADQFYIEGLEGVLDKMKSLPRELKAKGARVAGRKAANVIRDAAKAGWARVDRTETPNNIAANVAVQFGSRTFRRTGDIMFRVGIRGGAKQYKDTKENRRGQKVGKTYKTGGATFYWRFYELGTSHQPARPIMQPAIANNAGKATDVFVAELNRQIDRIIAKGK
jgi:HK97 gp10 family phage protein